jgi:hypothetical protein
MNRYYTAIETLARTTNTDNAFGAGMKQIERQFHVTERVIKVLKNGIKLIGVYDKNDVLINEYHR